jgi:hypothetical protein
MIRERGKSGSAAFVRSMVMRLKGRTSDGFKCDNRLEKTVSCPFPA